MPHIKPQAIETIQRRAKDAATSVDGTIARKAADLKRLMAGGAGSAGVSAASFAVSHIPFVGPTLGKGVSALGGVAAQKIEVAAYENLLAKATTVGERVNLQANLLELNTVSDMRAAYNVLSEFVEKSSPFGAEPKDCQDGQRYANGVAIAAQCRDDLETYCTQMESLLSDVRKELRRMQPLMEAREAAVPGVLRHMLEYVHKEEICNGMHAACYIAVAQTLSKVGGITITTSVPIRQPFHRFGDDEL